MFHYMLGGRDFIFLSYFMITIFELFSKKIEFAKFPKSKRISAIFLNRDSEEFVENNNF